MLPPPAWLDSTLLHAQLAPGASAVRAGSRYAEFVAQGRGVNLWKEALTGQIYLGGAEFVQRMQEHVARADMKGIPRVQQRAAPRPLPWYFDCYERNGAILQAFLQGGYTQSAIAEIAGLSVSRISRLIRRGAKGET